MLNDIGTSAETRVRYGLIRMYFGQVLLLKLGNISTVVLVFSILWPYADRRLMCVWLLLHLGIAAVELLAARAFRRQPAKLSSRAWVYLLIPPTLLSGLLWGAVATLIMDSANSLYLVLTSILLLGVMSGALYTLSLLPPLFHLFVLSILIQYAWVIYLNPDLHPLLVGVMVFGLFFMWLSYVLFHTMKELLFSRDRNDAYACELQRAKEAAEQANAAKGRFLAAASHDICQPLHAIGLYIESLRHRLVTDDAMSDTAAPVFSGLQASHTAMRKIMDSLLEISRLEAGVITPNPGAVRLSSLVDRVVESIGVLAEQKGLHIRLRIADLTVCSDYNLLLRIVTNLLSNAVRYTDSGGVLIACRRRGGAVLLEVWDTGVGIPQDKQESVFFEFYQLDNPARDMDKGLGLGLATVLGMVRLLPQHRIELSSRPGQGSRFRLLLPESSAMAPAAVAEALVPDNEDFHGLHILMIEDDVSVSHAMRDMLSQWGCRVTAAANSEGAEAFAQQWQAKQQIPAAVIADFRLPGKSTGVDAVLAVRAIFQDHVPALILTGENQPDVLKAIKMHDLLLLHKPVQPVRLRLFLRQCRDAKA